MIIKYIISNTICTESHDKHKLNYSHSKCMSSKIITKTNYFFIFPFITKVITSLSYYYLFLNSFYFLTSNKSCMSNNQ